MKGLFGLRGANPMVFLTFPPSRCGAGFLESTVVPSLFFVQSLENLVGFLFAKTLRIISHQTLNKGDFQYYRSVPFSGATIFRLR